MLPSPAPRITPGLSYSDVDGPVGIERPSRVVRHFPDISIRIGERSSCPTPDGNGSVTNNRSTGLHGLIQHIGNFLGRAHVVRQLDPGSTVASQSSPQSKDHASSLEEADLVIGLLRT